MKQKILIVDDEENILFVTKAAFTANYEVFTASSGLAAIEIIKKESPAFIFLDIKMPGMSGIEVLEVIGGLSARPIVWMLTGDDDLDTATKTLRAGASGYITKPFDIARLREVVLGAMETSSEEGKPASEKPWHVKKKK